jgi:hypothetical protein
MVGADNFVSLTAFIYGRILEILKSSSGNYTRIPVRMREALETKPEEEDKNNTIKLNQKPNSKTLHSFVNEVTGELRRLHNKKLYALYSSLNIIRVMKPRRLRWAGHVACMGKRRGAYRVLVGKPERRNAYGTHKRRWEDNIKMDL